MLVVSKELAKDCVRAFTEIFGNVFGVHVGRMVLEDTLWPGWYKIGLCLMKTMIFDSLVSSWTLYHLKCHLIWEVSLKSYLVYFRRRTHSLLNGRFPEHSQFSFYRVSKST